MTHTYVCPSPAERAVLHARLATVSSNASDIQARMTSFETDALALPLDGLLSQQGEVYARFTNRGPDHLELTVPGVFEFSCGAGNHLVQPIWNSTTDELVSGCTNHGAMATHIAPGVEQVGVAAGGPQCPRLHLSPGAASGWIEVGRLMDTLNFNTWTLPRGVQPLNLTSNYTVTVGVIKRDAMLQGGGAQVSQKTIFSCNFFKKCNIDRP